MSIRQTMYTFKLFICIKVKTKSLCKHASVSKIRYYTFFFLKQMILEIDYHKEKIRHPLPFARLKSAPCSPRGGGSRILSRITHFIYYSPGFFLPWFLCQGYGKIAILLQMTIFFFLSQMIKTSATKYPFLFVTCFAKLFLYIACDKRHCLIQNTGLLLPDFLEV